jgi:DNA-directed RNA polymerase specialized sigma24 family protein
MGMLARYDHLRHAAIRAWRLNERCRTPARPDPWLAAIARHEALRLLDQPREQSLDERDAEPPNPTRASPIGSSPWTLGESCRR